MKSGLFLWKFCRLFGLYPIADGKYSRCSYWRGLTVLLCLGCAGTSFILFEVFVLPLTRRARMTNAFHGTVFLVDYFTIFVAAASPFGLGKARVVLVHKSFARVSAHFHCSPSAPKVHKVYLAALILWVTFILVDTAHLIATNIILTMHFPFVLLTIYVLNTQAMIASIILHLSSGYDIINHTLRQGRFLTGGHKPYFILRDGKRTMIILLDRLMVSYRLLKTAEDSVKDTYGPVIVANCFSIFTHLFIAPFYGLSVGLSVRQDIVFCLSMLAFITFYFGQLLFLTVPPSIKMNKTRETGYLLAKLLSSGVPKRVAKKMVHSSILYVVILMQFQPFT